MPSALYCFEANPRLSTMKASTDKEGWAVATAHGISLPLIGPSHTVTAAGPEVRDHFTEQSDKQESIEYCKEVAIFVGLHWNVTTAGYGRHTCMKSLTPLQNVVQL